jgi:ligand-binding sensor domain-containing protein/serine phosphatase RsbU (regulator of sigma subunit)
MLKHILYFLLFNLFVSFECFPQEYNFDYWGVDEGLSQSVINCIYQDFEGYLWIGTQNGLNQFNGYSFKSYLNNPNDTTTISGNWVYDILEDKKGFIWVSTKQGVSKLNKRTEKFIQLDHRKNEVLEVPNRVVYGLELDAEGNVILNAAPYVFIYYHDLQKFEQIKYDNVADDGITDQQMPLMRDKSGRVWIGTKNGLFICHNKRIRPFRHNERGPIGHVTSLFQDRNFRIWIGTSNGLFVYDKFNNTFNVISEFHNSIVRSVVEDSRGKIWIGTERGLFKLSAVNVGNDVKFQKFSKIDNLSHEIVYDLLIDKSNNMWVGTLQGLDKTNLKPSKFVTYRKSLNPGSVELVDNVVASIYKYNDSIVWIGSWGKGLSVLNRKTNRVTYFSTDQKGEKYIINDFVHVIFKDHLGYYWLGTRDGLLVYDEKGSQFVRPNVIVALQNMPDLKDHRIFKIIQDNLKRYWFATQKGVYCVDYVTGRLKHYAVENEDESTRLTNNLVYDIIQDQEGLFWIGTSNGLNVLNKKTDEITQYTFEPNNDRTIGDNFIVSLCQAYKGKIWIGTASGLFMYDKSSSVFKYFQTDYDIPAKLIYEIVADKNSNLWLATQDGLIFYNPNESKARTYTIEEGLQGTEFNLNAQHVASDGEMFFGGMNGFNSFYIDSLYVNNYVPPVVISNFTKRNNNKLYHLNVYKDEVFLKYDDYEISIEFAALEYTNPIQNEYAYKMEGLTNDWIEIGNRRFVNFSNLSPGNYTFYLIGSNNDGIWNKKGRKLTITVKPPWYRTNFAYISYVVLLVVIIFLFIKTRERKLIRDRNVLEEKVKERTKEIEKQKQIVEKSHKEIKSSINYASKIQQAMMPHKEHLDSLFNDYCLFYKPRDVVSGDFYWVRKINQFVVFAVGDCTGHGVPGAMVSMLGISAINDIIRRQDVLSSAQVLNYLRDEIKTSLRQDNFKAESKDGLEIAFCIYDTEKKTLDYAGAQSPLWILKYNKAKPFVEEIKGTPNPISIHIKEIPFRTNQITLEPTDQIFIFSDGFIDQFNGETGEKYKKKRLKQLLVNNYCSTLPTYNDLFEYEFKNWKGDSDQIDDILIMGISVQSLNDM